MTTKVKANQLRESYEPLKDSITSIEVGGDLTKWQLSTGETVIGLKQTVRFEDSVYVDSGLLSDVVGYSLFGSADRVDNSGYMTIGEVKKWPKRPYIQHLNTDNIYFISAIFKDPNYPAGDILGVRFSYLSEDLPPGSFSTLLPGYIEIEGVGRMYPSGSGSQGSGSFTFMGESKSGSYYQNRYTFSPAAEITLPTGVDLNIYTPMRLTV